MICWQFFSFKSWVDHLKENFCFKESEIENIFVFEGKEKLISIFTRKRTVESIWTN